MAKAQTLFTNRYRLDMPKEEIYEEITAILAKVKNEETEIEWSEIGLDFANSNLIVGHEDEPTIFSLSAHAEEMLANRVGLGNCHNILSKELFQKVEREIEADCRERAGGLIVKHRGGIATAILSDRYSEFPIEENIGAIQDMGAHPIRLTYNDKLVQIQAILADEKPITPDDGNDIFLGFEMQLSEVGKSARQFSLFTYRSFCQNGMVFGKNNLFKFRNISIDDRSGLTGEIQAEANRVIKLARNALSREIATLIAMPIDKKKVVQFIARQSDIGKKAAEALLIPITHAVTMWDAVNILTEAGHRAESVSQQLAFERAAGNLMIYAAA